MRRLLLSPALAPVVGACIAALLLLAAVPWLSPKTTRVWKGYYALLVREDAVGEETMRRALARASADALWEESAVVTFSDLESVAETTYGALSARLDSADPRMDPWLRGMDGYFRVRETGGAFPAGAGGISCWRRRRISWTGHVARGLPAGRADGRRSLPPAAAGAWPDGSPQVATR